MTDSDFIVGDLVWAKMKGYPYWPGKIVDPTESKQKPKKGHHYVLFFGSKNYAWMPDDTIRFHSESMLSLTPIKKVGQLQAAIDEIVALAKEHPPRVVPEREMAPPPPSPPKKSPPKKSLGARSKEMKIKPEHDPAMPSTSKFNMDDVHMSSSSSDDEKPERPPPMYRSTALPRKQFHPPSAKKIGFLGLGMMGQGIVKNLLESRHQVTVWNRTGDKCDVFVKAGAVKAETVADVVQASDIIFSCVSDETAVKSLVFSNMGVLKGLEGCPSGEKGYVELSTIYPHTSAEICEAITRKGCKYLEAPISGSGREAYDGQLLVLGSGDISLFKECEPCFHAFTRHAYFVSCNIGDAFKYSIVKNAFLAVTYGAMSETLILAERFKLPSHDLLNVCAEKGFNIPNLIEKAKDISKRNYEPDTVLKEQQQIMELGLQMSHELQTPLHITTAANENFKKAIRQGFGDSDVSAVFESLKN